jgi:hypothetical protein
MAAVTQKKDPAAPFASRVDEQLAEATSRIRTHDLAFGGLLLAALLLGYATAMIVLDKSFVLPEWVRQAALAAFLAVLASAAYLAVVRPLRRRINPLYAAKQVERTLDDNKNSVTGYVDAAEKGELNPTVKAALASRAAQAAAEADVNRAVDHRSLLYVGGVAVALLLALVVLFFVFRPAQFVSLVNRAFNPFSPTPIGSRTQLALVKPDPADATITTGQSVTVAVRVGGKVPAADGPERVRLLVRHNPSDPNYDELPMVPGETSRDFELRVPDYLVQNGFWYKVAGGDHETPEHHVTVRSLPAFTDFRATYEYPKYLRFKAETSNDPIIRAYRGTKVTLVAKTNREVRDGLMIVEPGNARIPGTPVAGQPDSLQFVIPKLTESGRYKLGFTASNGEAAPDPFAAAIKVEVDQAPRLVINKPEEEETQVPANGQIAIDGNAGDDFGIDTVTLKMKIVEPAPARRPLPDVPYLNGKSRSFRREDNTWPTDLVYKGSVDLAKLKKDAAGLDFDLQPDMVIELWLEATDNCTEPKPNVGRSVPKRVRLTPPKMQEVEKEQLDQQKQERQNEENKHNEQQQQKFEKEKRDRNQQKGGDQKKDNQSQEKQPGDKTEPKEGQPQPKDGQPQDQQPDKKQGGESGMGNQPPANKPKGSEPKSKPEPKAGDNQPKEGDPNTGMGAGTDMNTKPDPQSQPNDKGGKGQSQKQDEKNVQDTAKEFEQQLKQEEKNGGAGKRNPEPKPEERDEPGKAKPEPKGGMGEKGMNNAAETKPEPKQPAPNDPMNPTGGEKNSAPSQSKPEGMLEKGQDPATTKPEPGKQSDGAKGKNGAAPSEKRDEPFGAPPGTDKEPPKENKPAPKNSDQKQDPASGSRAKPATQKPQEGNEPAGMPGAEKQDPASKAGSGPKPPMRDPTRGDDKPSEQPKPQPGGTDKKPDTEAKAGDAKPEKAPPAGESKPRPQGDMTGMDKGMESEPKPEQGANEPKKPNGTGAAETKPEEKPGKPTAGDKPVEKGTDKPQPKEGDDKGKPGDGAKAPDPQQMKKLEEAAKDLNSPDAKKREDAQKALDKAIGEDKRKELEQLQKDINSPDKDKQAAARKKLDDLKKQMKQPGKGEDKKGGKPDAQQQKEIADALKALQSGDKDKQEQARDKLDKMVGEQNRKDAEQLMNDLKSDDPKKREDAQKKLEDIKKQMEGKDKKDGKDKGGEPKPKEPSPEELKDLVEKAKDLNSPDDKKRKAAERELDDKIGEENRKKLQEEMRDKKQPDPKQQADDLKEKMEEWRQGLGRGTPNKGRMKDLRDEIESAELNLKNFESDEYRKKLQSSKGWTDAEYDDFLNKYRKYAEGLKKEADNLDKPAPAPMPGEPGRTFSPGGGRKVEATGPGGVTTGSGTTAAPPGFEKAREPFEKALKKKNR